MPVVMARSASTDVASKLKKSASPRDLHAAALDWAVDGERRRSHARIGVVVSSEVGDLQRPRREVAARVRARTELRLCRASRPPKRAGNNRTCSPGLAVSAQITTTNPYRSLVYSARVLDIENGVRRP